jgi:hypothetical protein
MDADRSIVVGRWRLGLENGSARSAVGRRSREGTGSAKSVVAIDP